ncbi:MAG: hypothetical protein OCC45_01805 [Desulfotalea sp.]
MYTDEDLNEAIKGNIFDQQSVDRFRSHIAQNRQTPMVDEENFRLIGGFNDIFVVIACSLLLVSASWAGNAIGGFFAILSVPVLSWGLAEFFVRKRKMALPAIVLLLSFVGGIFAVLIDLLNGLGDSSIIIAAGVTTIAVYVHWRRFRVPITVAAGAGSVTVFFIALVSYVCYGDIMQNETDIFGKMNSSGNWIAASIFISGIAVFFLAMKWDSSDRQRISRQSDVAFWLHLLAAPLIVHPAFAFSGVLEGAESISGLVVISFLYLLLTCISIVIDRRAFMVSSLAYVLYAISNVLEVYGVVGYSFAITGICISGGLLFLSAFWHNARKMVLGFFPESVKKYVPVLRK